MAGACWGVDGISAGWLDGLAGLDKIEGAARALTSACRCDPPATR